MQHSTTKGIRDPLPRLHLKVLESGGNCYQNLEKVVIRRGLCSRSEDFELMDTINLWHQ